MRLAQHAARTKPLRLEARHAGFDAELFGRRLAAMTMPSPRRPPPTQTGRPCNSSLLPERDFATGKEAVAVHMQDAVGWPGRRGWTWSRSKSPKILTHVCELLRPEAAAREIEIATQVDDSLPRVMADPVRLTQALLNVVINAIQAVERKAGSR
jgi:hypothetical protein